jgi:hypothetical protein
MLTNEVLDELQYATQLYVDSGFDKVQCDAKILLDALATARQYAKYADETPIDAEFLKGIGFTLHRETLWRLPLPKRPHQFSQWFVVVHDVLGFVEMACERKHGTQTLTSWLTVTNSTGTRGQLLRLLADLGANQ